MTEKQKYASDWEKSSDDFVKQSIVDNKPVDDPIALMDEIYSSQNSNEVSQNNSGGFWG